MAAAIRSCVTPVSGVAGKSITTIEGLSPDSRHPLQAAWVADDVPQCGYCQSGMLMSAAALLTRTPAPTDADIDRALSGHICRCGTYLRIRSAIHRAAAGSRPADAARASGRGTRERGRMSEVVKLTRRQFVALWPGATAGFALGVYVAGLPRAAFAAAAPSVFIPNVYVRLDSTGAATIMLPMSEMGRAS